ncbi:MAG: hypothetical protein Q4G52_04440 [Clostridia bacterium]|nr:hypothetical protein [Clostridia bacterium]
MSILKKIANYIYEEGLKGAGMPSGRGMHEAMVPQSLQEQTLLKAKETKETD